MKKTQYVVLQACFSDFTKLFPAYNFHVTFKIRTTLSWNVLCPECLPRECFAVLPWERDSMECFDVMSSALKVTAFVFIKDPI